MNTQLQGSLAVLGAAILWGTTGTAAAFAPDVSPIAIGAVAMGGGGLLQALLAKQAINQDRHKLKEQWKALLFGALAVAIYPLAFYASMRLAGITIGTVISIGSAPLLSALIEWKFDRATLTKRWLFGSLLGLIGIVLISISEHRSAVGEHVVSGIGLGLIAGLTYAFYSWIARKLMQQGIAARASMGAMFGVSNIVLLPVLLLSSSALLALVQNAMVGLYMAFVPMFLGYVCFGYGLARIRASTAITITLFEPVVAALLAVTLVGERLPLNGWLGVGLIIACLFVVALPGKSKVKINAVKAD